MLKTRSPRQPGEAHLKYLDADFKVIAPGDFVICAVTGKKIPLMNLRYWSVDEQEAYYDAMASSVRWHQLNGRTPSDEQDTTKE